MTPLTQKQSQILNFIRTFSTEQGHCPSLTEIANGLGVKSKSGIHYKLQALEERGAIRRLHNRARSIEVIASDTLSVKLAPDIRRALDKIAAREGVEPHVTVSEIVRSYLGMGA